MDLGKFCWMFVTTVLCCSIAGCGDSGKLAVSGTVTVDGKLVSQGTVKFLPVAGGRSGGGDIKEDGSYLISYLEIGDGMPPGDYIVTVLADEFIPAKGGEDIDDPALIRGRVKHLVPIEYNRRKTTPLRMSVTAGGSADQYNIEIDTKKK